MRNFENLRIWQDPQLICREIYNLFASSKDFGLKDQIQRASVSISNNIVKDVNLEVINYLLDTFK